MNKNPIVSYFPDGIDNVFKSYRVTIQKLHAGIVNFSGWIKPTEQSRAAYIEYGKSEEYKAIRNKLPYITPGGVWNNRSKTGKLLKPSNLVQIDIDELDAEAMAATRKILVADVHTLLLFTSPSGAGLKALVYCENFSSSAGAVLIDYYQQMGIVLDKSTLHDKATCFVCHDSSAYLNLEAEPFIIKTAPSLGKKVFTVSFSAACSTDAESTEFCKAAIEKRARQLAEAPEHTGSATLNKCAFFLGMFANAGLSKSEAEQALREAYLKRPYRRHTEAEFIKSFNGGWEAGKAKKSVSIDKPSAFAKASKRA